MFEPKYKSWNYKLRIGFPENSTVFLKPKVLNLNQDFTDWIGYLRSSISEIWFLVNFLKFISSAKSVYNWTLAENNKLILYFSSRKSD